MVSSDELSRILNDFYPWNIEGIIAVYDGYECGSQTLDLVGGLDQ
jgi:hypothetical protein